MPRLCLALIVVLVTLADPASAQPSDSAPVRVMTFNIRLNTPADNLNAWPHREEAVAGVIRFHDVDLVGLQEPQRNQLADLDSLLPGYAWFGLPRADGGERDEYSAVLYRTDRLALLDHDTFWLSESPDVPGLRGWDAAYPRIVTWGRFRDLATGDTLFHFNTHFDHVGEQARVESARLIGREVRRIAGDAPTIVTGDFNATPDSEAYEVMTSGDAPFADAATVSVEPAYGPNSTWNGFDAIVPGRRIDYVFVRGDGIRVHTYGVLAETYDGVRYPSDHLPVLAEISVE